MQDGPPSDAIADLCQKNRLPNIPKPQHAEQASFMAQSTGLFPQLSLSNSLAGPPLDEPVPPGQHSIPIASRAVKSKQILYEVRHT